MDQASQPASPVSTPTAIATPSPELRFVTCPGASTLNAESHELAYWSWGDPANPRTLVCVHGLSRQGRDFDVLARALSDRYHVVCPDVVGRGHSDRLADPASYQIFTYVSDMVVLLRHLRENKGQEAPVTVDWVGTSMGGLIALGLLSLPPQASGVHVRKLVLNDVGPKLRHEAVARIGDYLGQPKHFQSEQEAADYLWSISTGFGAHSPEQWLDLSRPLLRPAPDGQGLVLHYDPAIAAPFKSMNAETASSGEAMLWQIYDQLNCEVLLVRGQESDLLDADTARQMTERGPKARLIEFAGVGHAPTLIAADQVAAVEEFLRA